MSSNFSHVTKWSGFVHQVLGQVQKNASHQIGQRLLTCALLAGVGTAISTQKISCPIWNAGCACPTCGITRATHALLANDWALAFYYQAFFPYWLGIATVIVLSFLSYIIGFTRHADALGKRFLDHIPAALHVSIWTLSLFSNWYRYGLNPEGWLLALILS